MGNSIVTEVHFTEYFKPQVCCPLILHKDRWAKYANKPLEHVY